MTLEKLDLGKKPRIVMAFRPDCHPSNLAIAQIESTPELKSIFERHAVLIAPTFAAPELPRIAAWNKAHPSMKDYLAYSSDDWPQFMMASTPTFYFIKDGRIVSSFVGWGAAGVDSDAELRRGLKSIGLSAAPAR